MTRTRRDVLTSIGLQPRLLNQAEAAAYVGVTAKTFMRDVRSGIWPGPVHRKKWDRHAIDRVLDDMSGLSQTGMSEADRFFRSVGQ